MNVFARLRKTPGGPWYRDTIDVRPGRKLIPGSVVVFQGLKWKVLAAGYEGAVPVVHMERRGKES